MRHKLLPFFTPMENDRATVYLSGKMTGEPDQNKAAFDAAAQDLRMAGYAVCNPHETSDWLGKLSHERYLRFDFARILEADFVVALPHWQNSIGARAEIFMAITMGTKVWGYVDKKEITLARVQNAMPRLEIA